MAEDTITQSASDAERVESLIQGRAKRSTAGRHMSALLNAEADDELALLFEEVEDDNEFYEDADPDAGEDDDVLESSSDDEDQGPNAQDEDFEGEKELQKEAKAEKKRKKQQETFNLQTLRKRVKIDPAAVQSQTEPAPRPKKKSERISWIPTVEDGPTRSSSRRQTMQNKEVTHARLKDSEEKRVRLIATMEEAAKRKARFKPKEMTQAERLAEAERVEKQNSKSLNRWEEMEKRKADERLAKIEALQNRRLEGPVISYWSGLATWVNGRLTRVGNVDVIQKQKQDKEEKAKKSKKAVEKDDKNGNGMKPLPMTAVEISTSGLAPVPALANAQGPVSGEGDVSKQDQAPPNEQGDPNTSQAQTQTQTNGQANGERDDKTQERSALAVTEGPTNTPTAQPSTEASNNAPDNGHPANGVSDQKPVAGTEPPPAEDIRKGSIDNATEAPKGDPMDIDQKPIESAKEPGPETTQPSEASKAAPAGQVEEIKPDATPQEAPPSAPAQATPQIGTSAPAVAAAPAEITPAEGMPMPTPQEQLAPDIHMDEQQPVAADEGGPGSGIPPPPPTIEQTGRTLTILENFDDKTAHSREFNIYFNAKKPPRLAKISSSLCVITSLPSRYRDPETSLPFANAYAHKEIRNTVDQRYAWSPMLGCYVGPAGVAARGVPERFLGSSQTDAEGQSN
ncbi:hypothetical protein SI65_08670 [Aspergillus cristatus]|uniref:Vps72/YL1 C-terminal domain-containing protein n=1 Tax=Aspergillus cristatus TaxID=573508 RepID=A0A1E3B4E6_ASPCR|nr:hypothetical protein SI65_08670 [Aspergillus cristatus]